LRFESKRGLLLEQSLLEDFDAAVLLREGLLHPRKEQLVALNLLIPALHRLFKQLEMVGQILHRCFGAQTLLLDLRELQCHLSDLSTPRSQVLL